MLSPRFVILSVLYAAVASKVPECKSVILRYVKVLMITQNYPFLLFLMQYMIFLTSPVKLLVQVNDRGLDAEWCKDINCSTTVGKVVCPKTCKETGKYFVSVKHQRYK
jgi:hypothetical protein